MTGIITMTDHESLKKLALESLEKVGFKVIRPARLSKHVTLRPDLLCARLLPVPEKAWDLIDECKSIEIVWGEVVDTNFNGFPAVREVKDALLDVLVERDFAHFAPTYYNGIMRARRDYSNKHHVPTDKRMEIVFLLVTKKSILVSLECGDGIKSPLEATRLVGDSRENYTGHILEDRLKVRKDL
jgi:hypothetical protein